MQHMHDMHAVCVQCACSMRTAYLQHACTQSTGIMRHICVRCCACTISRVGDGASSMSPSGLGSTKRERSPRSTFDAAPPRVRRPLSHYNSVIVYSIAEYRYQQQRQRHLIASHLGRWSLRRRCALVRIPALLAEPTVAALVKHAWLRSCIVRRLLGMILRRLFPLRPAPTARPLGKGGREVQRRVSDGDVSRDRCSCGGPSSPCNLLLVVGLFVLLD